MILEGKVIKMIGVQEGISTTSGKEWKLAQYLIDTTTNEQYPKQVAVEVFGNDRIDELSIIPDERVKLNVEVESREFNGKWYTSVRAWGRAEDAKPTQPQIPTATQVNQPAEYTTDLPF
jgi:hypothetical protein